MKLVHRGKEVDCKVNLPKDVHWKILGKLFEDLEDIDVGNENVFKDDNSSDDTVRKHILHAIRMRDSLLLKKATSEFSPQSMVDLKLDRHRSKFFARYQIHSFLKKYPEKGTDTRKKALDKFFQVERVCKLYNEENHKALLRLDSGHPEYFGIIAAIRDDIATLLGELPDLVKIHGLSKHGPGATVLAKQHAGGETTQYYKWSKLPYTVTSAASGLVKDAIITDPRWIGALDDWYREKFSIPMGSPIDLDHFWSKILRVVRGSRTTTVPKSSDIDRTIALEPLGNLFLQLGVDGFIRGRLKRRWNIDLNCQEINQELARLGSIDGLLATLDLAAASDSITLMICQMLLPEAWYDLLLDLRSHETYVEGAWHPLEKISSMGNGYTFALESVIFASLVRVVMRRGKITGSMSVYGDDLILPTAAVEPLVDLLGLAGFQVNKEKSFSTGCFRESCGADWIQGFSVRPIFLKKPLKTVTDLFYLHNVLWTMRDRLDWSMGFEFRKSLAYIRKLIPKNILDQFYGPPGDSLDTHLFSDNAIRRQNGGRRVYWGIQAKARLFNKDGKSFYFRKLMVALKSGPPVPRDRWGLDDCFDTGNAFDVTKRDRVRYICARRTAWVN